MKLIRLTTENQNGVFNTAFNTDIEIEANSQIALSSVSFKSIISVLEIIAANNEVKFQISAGTVLTIHLDNVEYNDSNVLDLFSDMENKLNGALVDVGKMIGLQFRCHKNDQSEKVHIGYRKCPLMSINQALADPNLGAKTDIMNVGGTGVINRVGDSSLDDSCLFTTLKPLGVGCSVFRVKIHKLLETAPAAGFNGFSIGLTTTDPSRLTNPIQDDMKQFLIDITNPSAFYRYKTSTGNATSDTRPGKYGNGVANGGTAPGSTENDTLEIAIVNGNVRGRIYQADVANPIELFSELYVPGTSYYCFLSIQGALANTKVMKMRFTIDPHKLTDAQQTTLTAGHNANLSGVVELALKSTPNEPNPTGQVTQNELVLSDDVAEFLGYFSTINTLTAGDQCVFTANLLFNPTLNNINFYVLLDSIDLESYDSKEGTKKSILAVIPRSDNNQIVEFEPNNLNFIDMKNIKKNIRNIKARIIRVDDEAPLLTGISSLVLLIK